MANAGILHNSDIEVSDMKPLQHTIDVNTYHVALFCKVFLEMIKDKKSALIVDSSSAFLTFMPRAVTYSASKAFATYFTQGVYTELKDAGLIDV